MIDHILMQQALNALDGYARNCRCEGGGGTTDAAEALRARLELPEQEPELPLKARHAAQEALNALMRWQEICLAKNRSTKELTIPTKAIHALTEILEVKGSKQ